MRCPSCGFENPPRFKFCGACGTPLIGQPYAPQATPTDELRGTQAAQTMRLTPPAAERRQLTVLFCDLVDSTPLATQLDPEELREVVQAYQRVCAEVIQRFEGYIAQYLGDGLLVYFGYPQAHEDDGQRAVRAALGMVETMGLLNQHLVQERGVQLAVRIGIHTGLVVVGEMGGGRQEQLALGDTPNMAARLQALAAPDTIVISAATHRLIQGFFHCRDLGPHTLKGIPTPVSVYRVIEESGAQSRLEVASTTGLTPLVGREQEVGLLLEHWAQAKAGRGQVVLLNGEAGIGKSRLVQTLKERLAGEPYTRLECRCSAYHRNSPLYPVIDLYQRALQFSREDSSSAKLGKLEKALAQLPLSLSEVVPPLASLLSLPLGERYLPLTLTPQQQRQKTLEALLAVLMALAAQQPVLFVLEDIHWLDPSTLEFLSGLVDQTATRPLFTLLTCRPTFRPPWAAHAHLTYLTLSRLPRHQAARMIAQVAGGRTLPAEVHQQLLTRTDGVPLFVEELTKMVLESGFIREADDRYELTGPLPTLAIPATLHDSLMARLDRLNTAKTVAQLGAAVGRQFSYELLRAVRPMDEATLQQALGQLVETELLYQRGLPPQATYVFKHALIQEAAYQSLLKSVRQQYHQQIAQALVGRFPETVDTQPELLAHHYTEAGLAGQAVSYWQRAGQRAIERSANVEAISHLTRGLEVLKTVPEMLHRTRQELDVQTALGPALMATKGAGAPEVERTYARARELCQQVGDTPQLFPVLYGLWLFYLVRAQLQTAQELGEQLLRLAQRTQEVALILEAHRALGTSLFYRGELVLARTHLERALALYDPQEHHALAFRSGQDPGVVCRGFVAWALGMLGYPDQALRRSHETLTLPQELSHAFSLAYALDFAARIHQLRREGQLTQAQAQALIALSREQGFTQRLATGTILWGWALTAQGQGEEGIAHMRQGLTAFRATGAELALPYYLALLGEAYGALGQAGEGLKVLAEALATTHKTGEQFCEAELHRLKGKLLLAGSAEHHAAAEACFQQALDVARRQRAKAWELRAAMSLSRLWQQQGRRAAARELLAPIYGWFTEGFDTADLQEAKALLAALA
ncbi:MAG: AAA family ATPase [Candidatus Entotheonellia bacterium]